MYLFLETVLCLLQFLVLSCEGVGGWDEGVGEWDEGVGEWVSVRDEGMKELGTEMREGGGRR